MVSYRLYESLRLAGETRPIESTLVERIVTANPSKDTLLDRPETVCVFQKLNSVDLFLLMRGIHYHLLACDTATDLAVTTRMVEDTLAGREDEEPPENDVQPVATSAPVSAKAMEARQRSSYAETIAFRPRQRRTQARVKRRRRQLAELRPARVARCMALAHRIAADIEAEPV